MHFMINCCDAVVHSALQCMVALPWICIVQGIESVRELAENYIGIVSGKLKSSSVFDVFYMST